MKKKIFILYATAGAGHKKAAEAIFRSIKDPETELKLLDIVTFMSPWNRRLYSDGYTFLISRLPWLWGFLYWASDTPWLRLLNRHLRRFSNARLCFPLLKFLCQERPDVVVSTQFLASEIASYAKQKAGLKSRLITVVTDFGVHDFWLSPETDIYCCASEMTADILRGKGVPAERVRVTGIPVDEKFNFSLSREQVLSELGLSPEKFTVLIATGGIGVGPIEEIAGSLKDEAQLLIVCGHNESLRKRLEAKNHPQIRLFGFIDYMERLMAASDLMVTKAGGLSVTEALVKGLPMTFFFLIPGQETINARTLSAGRAGVIATTPREIASQVLKFKDARELAQEYKKNCLAFAKPHSCQEIIALI